MTSFPVLDEPWQSNMTFCHIRQSEKLIYFETVHVRWETCVERKKETMIKLSNENRRKNEACVLENDAGKCFYGIWLKEKGIRDRACSGIASCTVFFLQCYLDSKRRVQVLLCCLEPRLPRMLIYAFSKFSLPSSSQPPPILCPSLLVKWDSRGVL